MNKLLFLTSIGITDGNYSGTQMILCVLVILICITLTLDDKNDNDTDDE